MNLAGRSAIITGGSRGIGRAIALKLASLGADIALIYQGSREKAEATAGEIMDLGVKAIAYRCDVASFAETKETVSVIRNDFAEIEVLVNNAGITRDGLVAMMDEESWDSVMDTNLKGAFCMIRHTVPLMLRRRSGRIISISSVSGLMGNPGQANYSASKAGIIGLTKACAKELAGRGITCNAIAPGFIRTDMTKDMETADLVKAIPLGRMGTPEDVAEAAAFLALSPYITGETIRVDGGISM